MEAGIKAGTGSREFRLSCPATSSHIDVVYPQHVARGIGGRGGVPCATKKFLVGQDRINSPDFLLPSSSPSLPSHQEMQKSRDGPSTIGSCTYPRKLIFNLISGQRGLRFGRFENFDKLRSIFKS